MASSPAGARAPVRKNAGWRLFLQTVHGRAYPRLIGSQRELWWTFFEVLLPILTVLGYVWVYRALEAPEEYVGFVVLGGAMIAFWANVLWGMSSQLYWEKEQGNLALFVIAPTSLMALLLGMAAGGLVATAVRAVLIVGLGSLFFHVPFEVQSLPMLAVVFLMTLVSLYGLGMMLASLFLLLNREAWHLALLIQEPVYLVSGFFFPITSLPFWVTSVSSIVPLTLGLDAIRQLVFRTGSFAPFLSVRVELLLLTALSALYVAAARFLLDHMERLAIRDGRLTESRT